jgi:HAD superfamily hydrolase (TIGR01509 family)
MAQVKAIIFDGGGTIWDSLPILYRTYQAAYREAGLGELPLDAATCHRLRGLPSFNREAGFAAALLAIRTAGNDPAAILAGGDPDTQLREMVARSRAADPRFDLRVAHLESLLLDHLYNRTDDSSYPLCHGAQDSLRQLKERGLRLCLVSNRRRASMLRILQAHSLADLFDVVIALEDQSRPKPGPEGPQQVLQQLGLPPRECVFVGDSAVDILCGRAMDLCCIGVLSGMADERTLHSVGAYRTIRSLSELPELLDRL